MGPALLAAKQPVNTSRHRLAERNSVANLGFHEPWLLTADWDLHGAHLVVASTPPAEIGFDRSAGRLGQQSR